MSSHDDLRRQLGQERVDNALLLGTIRQIRHSVVTWVQESECQHATEMVVDVIERCNRALGEA